MEGIGLNPLSARPIALNHPYAVDAKAKGESLVQQMKAFKKAKLNREVLADPSLIRKLVAVEASPVYNAKAELIPTVATSELASG